MEFRLPELGEGVYEAEMSRWLVDAGATVKPGQPLLEVLTDKATMEVPAPFAGQIQELKVQTGDQLKIGQVVLAYTGQDAATSAAAQEKVSTAAPAKTTARAIDRPAADGALAVKAAPSVRLMARKLNIDLASVSGSGPQGRILVDDLAKKLDHKLSAPPAPRADFGQAGTKIKLHGVRRKMAEHMVHATRTIPHFSYVDECDVTDLVRLRDALKGPFAQKGVKLTYLAFVVTAVAAALKEVPIANATLDDAAGEIVLHAGYHVGIAVAAPAGLIVPVVRDADKKSLLEVAQDVERLSNDARAGKAKLEDLKGGTFTITSIGNFGGLFATPIIHHPQVGILGIGKIVKRPVYDSAGNLKPADMVYLSLTFDHRVLDGAAATAFGNAVGRQLRQPMQLLLDLVAT